MDCAYWWSGICCWWYICKYSCDKVRVPHKHKELALEGLRVFKTPSNSTGVSTALLSNPPWNLKKRHKNCGLYKIVVLRCCKNSDSLLKFVPAVAFKSREKMMWLTHGTPEKQWLYFGQQTNKLFCPIWTKRKLFYIVFRPAKMM